MPLMLAMVIVSGLTCNPWVLMASIRRLYMSRLVLMEFISFIFFLCFCFDGIYVVYECELNNLDHMVK